MLLLLLLLLQAAFISHASFAGNYFGCKDAASKSEKYCDTTISDKERVDDIMSRLNLVRR